MNNQIAVITPTKNRKQYLSRCIESVAAQTYKNFEHIIVDDHSMDGTWKLLQQMQKKYKHIIPLKIEKVGIGGARGRNQAIRHTKAEYIAYLDDDDFFYDNHLEVLMKHFTQHKGCQFAYCAAHKTKDGKHISAIWNTNIWDEDIRAVNLFPICAVVHSKKIWTVVSGMDETIGVYEDWDLWQRIVHHGFVPCYINRTTSLVDVSSKNSIQHSETTQRKQEVGELIRAKMPTRKADYYEYLKERIALNASSVNKIPKRKRKPTHKDTLRKIVQKRIQTEKRAQLWKTI